MATHSSILSWKILWTEEPGGLESMDSQRVGHDLVTTLSSKCPQFLITQRLPKSTARKMSSSISMWHFPIHQWARLRLD